MVYVYCEINFEWVVFATGECVEDQISAFEHQGLVMFYINKAKININKVCLLSFLSSYACLEFGVHGY